MKIEFKTNDKKSNVNNNEKIDITISNSKIVSDLLRKHYAHPIRTLVQEYLSNAKDAQKESKTDKKIIVTMPSKVSPLLKIRDFGLGLSPEKLKNVFALLGESTKRLDNDFIGGFGIGSKSAFAYRDNFFVRSFNDGIERLYEINTARNYEGCIEKLFEAITREENGVEIEIPVEVEDIEEFHKAVYRATWFWSKKPVLLGVDEVELPAGYVEKDVMIESKNWLVIKNHSEMFRTFFSSNYLMVIDEIAYDIKENLFFTKKDIDDPERPKNMFFSPRISSSWISFYTSFVFIVPTGHLQVAISREELDYSKVNKDKVIKLITDNTAELIKEIQVQTDKFKPNEIIERFRFVLKFNKFVNITDKEVILTLSKELDIKYNTNNGIHLTLPPNLRILELSTNKYDPDNLREMYFRCSYGTELKPMSKSFTAITLNRDSQGTKKQIRMLIKQKSFPVENEKEVSFYCFYSRSKEMREKLRSIVQYDLTEMIKKIPNQVTYFHIDRWRCNQSDKFTVLAEDVKNLNLQFVFYKKVKNKVIYYNSNGVIGIRKLQEISDFIQRSADFKDKRVDLAAIKEDDFVTHKFKKNMLLDEKKIFKNTKNGWIPLFGAAIDEIQVFSIYINKINTKTCKKFLKDLPKMVRVDIKNKDLINLILENNSTKIKEFSRKYKKYSNFMNAVKKEDPTLFAIMTSSNKRLIYEVIYDKEIMKKINKYCKYLR